MQQCGGSLLGRWSLADACYLTVQQPVVEGCEEASATAEGVEPEGEVQFDDAAYSFRFTVTMRLTVHLPERCRLRADERYACAELGGPLAGGEPLVCSDAAGGGCDCQADLPISGNNQGPYSLRDSQLSLRGEPFDYCVQGDRLLLNHELSSGQSMITLLQLALDRQR